MEEEKRMTFLDHLEELRWRLVRSAIAVLLVAIVLWIFQEWILENIFLTMKNADFITFKLTCEYIGICVEDVEVLLMSTTVSGQFSYALLMSFLGGIVIAFPFIFYQLWSFVRPGLKYNEKSVAKGIVFYVSMLFFLGISFGYFVVAPMAIQFFGSYQIHGAIHNNFTIKSYMSTVISTVFYTGLLFLLPVLAYLFTKIGVMSSQFLKKYRKHAIIAILILAALITPPDLISQVIVGVPILLLYEVGILVSKRVEKRREKQ
jgi:sec-independent protein translocase protein TatC